MIDLNTFRENNFRNINGLLIGQIENIFHEHIIFFLPKKGLQKYKHLNQDIRAFSIHM